MKTITIVNPKTGRENKVRAWAVQPRELLRLKKAGVWTSMKDLSWLFLNDAASIRAMEKELDGDSASSNFALSIFENALDYGIGMEVCRYIDGCVRASGRYPKPFQVAVSRSGNIFIITASGRVIAEEVAT